MHRDQETAGGPRREGEGSVVRLGDALDDRQAEADAGVVAVDAFGAAPERLREGRDQVRIELLARVLDGERHAPALSARPDPHGALIWQFVDDRVVQEVRGHLQQERV
jgi:hypothetical protein